QLVRRCFRLYLAVNWHLHAVRTRPQFRRAILLLELADCFPRAVVHCPQLRRALESLSCGWVGVSMDQVPFGAAVRLADRMDLPFSWSADSDCSDCDAAARVNTNAERSRLGTAQRFADS